MKHKKKPVFIEAMLLNSTNDSIKKCIEFTQGKAKKGIDGNLILETIDGDMVVNIGDYIVKGLKGEFYPCKSDVFEKTYEPVSN